MVSLYLCLGSLTPKIRVEVVPTTVWIGSVQNLQSMQQRAAIFLGFNPGVWEIVKNLANRAKSMNHLPEVYLERVSTHFDLMIVATIPNCDLSILDNIPGIEELKLTLQMYCSGGFDLEYISLGEIPWGSMESFHQLLEEHGSYLLHLLEGDIRNPQDAWKTQLTSFDSTLPDFELA